MSEESKCLKCRVGINETFQRGQLITGTRCLACGFETFAKICGTLGELRRFFDKMPDDTPLLFQDDASSLKLEAHYMGGKMDASEKVKIWRGNER
jgi:hypothetical protein